MIGVKPMHVRFDKVDWFIWHDKYDAIYNRIRYLISQKRGITYGVSNNFARIKIHSYDSLPLKRTSTFHNVVILIKSVFDKDIYYYYYIFLAKCSHK